MTYQPKTTAEQRKELVQYLCNVNHRGAKVQRIVDDLAACEAALAERQEILRSYLMELHQATHCAVCDKLVNYPDGALHCKECVS